MAMTLDELRTTLTELDEQLLNLVARRQGLSEQVASVSVTSFYGREPRQSGSACHLIWPNRYCGS
jgi:hypothetical protein